MQEFFNGRMILHKDYFENVNEIKNAYHFAKDVLDKGLTDKVFGQPSDFVFGKNIKF